MLQASLHGGDPPVEPLVSPASFRRQSRRPRNSCAGELQCCTYRSTSYNWGRSTLEINGIGGPLHGQPHDPARLIHPGAHGKPEGATVPCTAVCLLGHPWYVNVSSKPSHDGV